MKAKMRTRTTKRAAGILLTILLSVSLFGLTACGATAQQGGAKMAQQDSSSAGATDEATEHVVTDMAGREVTIATHPTKILGAANPDGILVYTIDPELLAGWTIGLSDGAKQYMVEAAVNLPKVTSVSKWEEPNKEELLSMDLDFILVSVDLTNVDLTLYDDLTKQTGIPIVVVDAELKNLDETYRFLGPILNRQEQCDKLANYISESFKDIDSTLSNVSKADRIRVLYSTGDTGTQTCGDSNWNGQFVTPAGGINVCDTTQTSGFADVSMEQVLSWQPAAIVSTAKGDLASIYGAETWVDVAAVQNKQVYAAPQLPFSWVDKPTSVNRIIGVKWTNSVLYPNQIKYDMKSDVKEFYQLFYHYDLSDSQVASLLDTKVFK